MSREHQAASDPERVSRSPKKFEPILPRPIIAPPRGLVAPPRLPGNGPPVPVGPASSGPRGLIHLAGGSCWNLNPVKIPTDCFLFQLCWVLRRLLRSSVRFGPAEPDALQVSSTVREPGSELWGAAGRQSFPGVPPTTAGL